MFKFKLVKLISLKNIEHFNEFYAEYKPNTFRMQSSIFVMLYSNMD